MHSPAWRFQQLGFVLAVSHSRVRFPGWLMSGEPTLGLGKMRAPLVG